MAIKQALEQEKYPSSNDYSKGADSAIMKKIYPFPKLILRVIVALIICFSVNVCYAQQEAAPDSSDQTNDFYRLTRRLIQDGFDPEKTNALLSNEGFFFDPGGVSLFFVHSESSLNYDQFSSPKSIANAREYMATHKESLYKAQEKFSVDKTIITAILLVETRLGTYLGKRTVINTLSTMAALTDKALAERVWQAISDNKKSERDAFDKKVDQKSRWGYEELKALISYADREGIDPVAVKGSYAGAMGIPQFMPSNALMLARDGNQDGKVNLFDHDDAIFSVANYLKHHGWKSGLSRQRQHEVLFRYNHSNYYVDALLKISDKLK